MITPASDKCCRIVKAAAIGRIAHSGCTLKQAEQVYDRCMDKLALASGIPGGAMAGGMAAPGNNVASGIQPQMQQQKQQPPPKAPTGVSGGVFRISGAQAATIPAAQEHQNKKDQESQAEQAQQQQQAQKADPRNIMIYRPPSAYDQAQQGLEAAASDRSLMICKAAAVLQASKYDINPTTALMLFNNQLNKCAHELIKVMR